MPSIWQKIKLIPIKDKAIKKLIGLDERQKYAAFVNFFDYKSIEPYKLSHQAEIANKTKPARRTQFDKDVIKIDEKVNILYAVYSGFLFKIFPTTDKRDDRWYEPAEAVQKFSANDSKSVRDLLAEYLDGVNYGINSGDWRAANESLKLIATYQQNSDLTLSPSVVTMELLYNSFMVFDKLKIYYFLLGVRSIYIYYHYPIF